MHGFAMLPHFEKSHFHQSMAEATENAGVKKSAWSKIQRWEKHFQRIRVAISQMPYNMYNTNRKSYNVFYRTV